MSIYGRGRDASESAFKCTARSKGGGHRARKRGLVDAGFALQEQRPPQPEGEKHGDGQAAIRHVVLRTQPLLQIGNRAGKEGVQGFPAASF